MHKRSICVVTGTRAEYGLLHWLMQEILDDPDLDLRVIATGMHLSPEFGLTYREIETDGFVIDEKVEMLLSSDTPLGITKSMGLALIGFADALERLKPDIVVLLGDRFEILAVAQAALLARIPIAHIHGGETTEGAVDEAIRHAVTKMAQFHFVSATPYRHRVIQLGEHPSRVWTVGAPGLDHLNRTRLLDRKAFEASISFSLGTPTFLITYHPATLSSTAASTAIQELFDALDEFPDAKLIFTGANADAEGRVINERIGVYVQQQPERAIFFTSLGQIRYLSALFHVDVVIGNSSSGLIEVPMTKTPTVNIGDRQRGRLRGQSVIDCEESQRAIAEAIKEALSPGFQDTLASAASPYGSGNASVRVKERLKHVELNNAVMKKFYDLDLSHIV